METNVDYYDIKCWDKLPEWMELNTSGNLLDLFKAKDLKEKTRRQYLRDFDIPKLYGLFKSALKLSPNGFYTYFQFGSLPMDNMFWWDFIIACEVGIIHLWRSVSFIEVMYRVDVPNFNIEKFLKSNIDKYSKEIDDTINDFDKHVLYINHYESYSNCVKYLWEEVRKIDLEEPNIPDMMVVGGDFDIEKIGEEIEKFIKNAVKFHALSKSLILNCAFMVDSFINLIYRIGAKPEVRENPSILKKVLNAEFKERVSNIAFYTSIFKKKINIGTSEFRDAVELMTLRNKYVHSDETSKLNQVGEVFFDRDFPLSQVDSRQEVIRNISDIYLIPNFELAKKSYESAIKFIDYVKGHLAPEVEEPINYLMTFNPIGYNTKRKVYSGIITVNQMPILQTKGETKDIKKIVK